MSLLQNRMGTRKEPRLAEGDVMESQDTSVPAPDKPCIQGWGAGEEDFTSFDETSGTQVTCSMYASPDHHHRCNTDFDKYEVYLAKDVCPQCGQCVSGAPL